jgi:hypothetical protein
LSVTVGPVGMHMKVAGQRRRQLRDARRRGTSWATSSSIFARYWSRAPRRRRPGHLDGAHEVVSAGSDDGATGDGAPARTSRSVADPWPRPPVTLRTHNAAVTAVTFRCGKGPTGCPDRSGTVCGRAPSLPLLPSSAACQRLTRKGESRVRGTSFQLLRVASTRRVQRPLFAAVDAV